MGWYDYVPGASNIAGIAKGDWKQATMGAGYTLGKKARNGLGYGEHAMQPTADQGSAQDPNVAFQSRQNYQTGQDLLGQLNKSRGEHDQAVFGQNRLSDQLNNTINNPNASSVAQVQNVMANDASARQQLGAAAGVQGPNAFAARRQALQAIGQGNVGTNQTGALLRAQEVANAQNQQGNLLGQMSTGADRRYSTDLAGAKGFADTALRGQESQQGLNKQIDDDNQKKDQAWGGKVLNFLGSLGGGG
jgi:hypothetical protein